MLNKELRQSLARFRDELLLPPRYMYGRKKGERAPVRIWLPPRPGRYERRRRKQLRRMGYSVRIWSPSVEPVGPSGLWGELAEFAYDIVLGCLFGFRPN